MHIDESKYHPFTCLLDRLLVREIPADVPEEGGFAVPDKFRQHSNWGEVVSIGQGIVLGQEWHPLDEFINPGDLVKYSEYCAEKYSLEDDGLWIVRLQDCRGVRRKDGR